MLKPEEYKFFLDYVYGLIVVDTDANIIFMSKQFADYIDVSQDEVVGKPIKEVFPPTKMDKALSKGETEIGDFYVIEGKTVASTRVPLRKNGKMVGLMEYDLFQDTELLEQFIENYINLDEEIKYYKEEVQKLRSARYSIDNIIGSSQAIETLKKEIRYAARTNSTVLIQGETGSGKELVAHSVHNLSKRYFQNLIRINAASIPENLVESELFGYEPGAFTGAKPKGMKGKFELADRGTIFIDEIEELPLSIQAKLLRAIQEREIDKIGGKKSIPIDIRIICATNQNLDQLVRENKFRKDLYYRLNVVKINVPPLRERKDDIPKIAEHTIGILNNMLGKNIRGIESKVIEELIKYDWPGNVRELQNVIEKAMNFADENMLKVKDFKFLFAERCMDPDMTHLEWDNPIEEIKKNAEREFIIKALELNDGNRTKTAGLLKISRPLLYQKMKRLNILYKK